MKKGLKAVRAIKNIMLNQNGATAVEFAIVLPFLLLSIFSIIEFSIFFYNKGMITDASREAARMGIVYNWPERIPPSEIRELAENYLEDRLIRFGGSPDDFTVTINAPDYTDEYGELRNVSGEPLTVSAAYSHNFLVLPNLSSLADVWNLTARTVMRME